MAELNGKTDSLLSVTSAPVLSTPAMNILEDPVPEPDPSIKNALTEEELYAVYEISRTSQEIQQGGFKRVALQFPDGMLQHATRVYRALEKELAAEPQRPEEPGIVAQEMDGLVTEFSSTTLESDRTIKLFILADTSYSSCCADEIAAEHVSADVIIHYGRACLSPTAHLPVIHVFTKQPVDIDRAAADFIAAFPAESANKVVLVADLPFDWCLVDLKTHLVENKSYKEEHVFIAKPTRDPSSSIPNRTTPPSLSGYSLFHLGAPPTALLLTLSSQITPPSIFVIFEPSTWTPTSTSNSLSTSHRLLRRRYAQLSRLPSTPILGILTAAPSSSALLPTLKLLNERIKLAGKKSYLISVGKMTPAKVANFSEIGMWIVVGCWESSLVENESGAFMAPMVTAWEAIMALDGKLEEVWSGIWRGEIDVEVESGTIEQASSDIKENTEKIKESLLAEQAWDDDEDDEEPEYDFKTGRLVTKARPMRQSRKSTRSEATIEGTASSSTNEGALIKQSQDNRQLAKIGGVVSPGAEFLRQARTWQGLGSDFETDFTTSSTENGTLVEEGRSGVARGYANEPGKDSTSSRQASVQ